MVRFKLKIPNNEKNHSIARMVFCRLDTVPPMPDTQNSILQALRRFPPRRGFPWRDFATSRFLKPILASLKRSVEAGSFFCLVSGLRWLSSATCSVCKLPLT